MDQSSISTTLEIQNVLFRLPPCAFYRRHHRYAIHQLDTNLPFEKHGDVRRGRSHQTALGDGEILLTGLTGLFTFPNFAETHLRIWMLSSNYVTTKSSII